MARYNPLETPRTNKYRLICLNLINNNPVLYILYMCDDITFYYEYCLHRSKQRRKKREKYVRTRHQINELHTHIHHKWIYNSKIGWTGELLGFFAIHSLSIGDLDNSDSTKASLVHRCCPASLKWPGNMKKICQYFRIKQMAMKIVVYQFISF